jgi:hypothetical protein
MAPEPRRRMCGATARLSQKAVPKVDIDHRPEESRSGVCHGRCLKNANRVHQRIGGTRILGNAVEERRGDFGIAHVGHFPPDVVWERVEIVSTAIDGDDREPLGGEGHGGGMTELAAASGHNSDWGTHLFPFGHAIPTTRAYPILFALASKIC